LIRQEFPKEASENADFAVVADDNGAVWISSDTGFSNKADFIMSWGWDVYYGVSSGPSER